LKNILNKIKDKTRNYTKTNILFFTFVITSVLNGMLLRFLTVKNYFEIKAILGDLVVVLVIGAFGYFLKPKHQFKYFVTWSVIFSVLCIVNSMYYTNYLSFASVSLLATSLQVIDVGDAVVQNVMEIKDFSYLWQIFTMIFVHVSLKKKDYYTKVSKIEVGKIRVMNTLIASLIVTGFFVSTLTSLDISRLGKQWNREYVVMKFGVYVYQANDIIASLKPQISPLFGYDENYKSFRKYYDENKKEEYTNEYTDILKDKNVIAIHAESIQSYLIDLEFNGQELMPNLKKIASEGLYFSNFYAQESVGTSSDTEFTYSTSLMPANSGTVFVSYWDREYETIQKLLKNDGYYTFSMHGNNCSFWNRNAVHKEFGYDRFYCYTKDYNIKETIGLGLSDKSFFKQSVKKIKDISKKHDKYYGLTIMLSNHTPFNNKGNDITDFDVSMNYTGINPETGLEEEMNAPYMEDTKLGAYFKSVHYADQAIGDFFNQLDAEGLLENTAIVIYGDHDAKVKRNEYNKFYNYDPKTDSVLDKEDPDYYEVDYYKYELNRKVPFIIWTKDNTIKPKEVTKVMGMYDVMPTLGNMMGFKSKYAVGNDIFNVDENVVVFPDGNWLTDKMYYSNQKEEGYLLKENDTVSTDYINKYNKVAEDRISVSNSIIVYDLIRKGKEKSDMIKDL
jgi:Phosphoglycerol transferase and related proteins, alkaline phosphatase superfamily